MEEKKIIRSYKRIIWIFICIYFLIVAGYFGGKCVGVKGGLEYRFWVDAGFRIWVWFVPVLLIGGLLLKAYIRLRKGKSNWRWILIVLLVGYIGIAAYLSLLYALFNAFTLTSDEKMPDGNLVVAVPYGMESIHHYAEPVGLLFRREFSFDEERTADSLSKIYGVTFRPLRKDNDQWVYGSDAYPGIEVTNISYSFIEAYYLDNYLDLSLTSKMLENHAEVFTSREVELVPYIYGQGQENPEESKRYSAVLVSEENKEHAADAIAAFIKITLQEDLRSDGKSYWEHVDGSIILVKETEEQGKYESFRTIPFSRKPQYTWIYGKSVDASELAEKIIFKNEIEDEAYEGLSESIAVEMAVPEVQLPTETQIMERYLKMNPSATCVTKEGIEYRMVAVDRALGSSYYVLISTQDRGKTGTLVNSDPYNGSGGESKWIIFLDENLGFSCLAHAAGAYGSFYRTEDGGVSWEIVEYPSAKVKMPDGTFYNPFVMPEKLYEEEGILYMEVGQGADGDYHDDEVGFCHGLYQSSDLGLNWEFVENIAVRRN